MSVVQIDVQDLQLRTDPVYLDIKCYLHLGVPVTLMLLGNVLRCELLRVIPGPGVLLSKDGLVSVAAFESVLRSYVT